MEKSKKYVVTLGRQFGCGARDIGQLIAKMLGIEYYDLKNHDNKDQKQRTLWTELQVRF